MGNRAYKKDSSLQCYRGKFNDFLPSLNQGNYVCISEFIPLCGEKSGIRLEAQIQYNDSTRSSIYSFLNGANGQPDSAEIQAFSEGIALVLNKIAPQYGKVIDDGYSLRACDCHKGLSAAINISVATSELQSGCYLNEENLKELRELTAESLTDYAEKNPEKLKNIVDHVYIAMEARIAARKARGLILQKTNLERTEKVASEGT